MAQNIINLPVTADELRELFYALDFYRDEYKGGWSAELCKSTHNLLIKLETLIDVDNEQITD